MDKVEIPLSRNKAILLILGASAFVFFGTHYILDPERFVSQKMKDPAIIRFVGIIGVLFFGAAGIYGVKKFFDKKMGLILDEKGIIDNSNASSVGRIDWIDIKEIQTEQIGTTKFLLIFTKEPQKYIKNTKGIKRTLLPGNNKVYGTPISITSKSLKYNFIDLERILKDKLDEYRKLNPIIDEVLNNN